MFDRPKNGVFFASGGSVTTRNGQCKTGPHIKFEGFLILWVAIFDFERLSAVGWWPVHGYSSSDNPCLWCFERHSLAFVGIFSTRSGHREQSYRHRFGSGKYCTISFCAPRKPRESRDFRNREFAGKPVCVYAGPAFSATYSGE